MLNIRHVWLMDTKTNGANNWDLGQDSRGFIIDSGRLIWKNHIFLTKSMCEVISPPVLFQQKQ